MSQPKDSNHKNPEKSDTPKSSEKMEDRVQDYLYNPDTKEKIEPPKEDPVEIEKKASVKKKTTSKKKSVKKIVKKKKIPKKTHPALKISIVAAKFIFLWVPVSLITIIFIALIIIKAILSPSRVENLIQTNFNSLSNSTITLNVKEFSPYNGFVIEELKITQPESFSGENFVSIDRIVLDYGFFRMFTGNVRFSEIGIYKPEINLVQKNGTWNFAKLMKEKEQAPKKEEEPPKVEEKTKDDTPPPESIKLPISVSLLFNFILEDLNVTVESDEFNTYLKSFDSNIFIEVPPVNEIPLGLDAVSLLKKFEVNINPEKKLDVGFRSDAVQVSPPLLLGFELLYLDENEESRKFNSNFIAGTSGTPIVFQEKNLRPLSFTAGYDLAYDPKQDEVQINSFAVKFAGDSWLDIGGSVKNVTTDPTIDVFMQRSAIVLDKLYPYYLAIMEDDSISFSGVISLMPFTVKGTPTNIDADGNIKINNLLASLPGFGINMPGFDFDYDVTYAESNVDAKTSLTIPNFVYKLGRQSSGSNNVYLNLSAKTAESFKRFTLSEFIFRLNDPRSGQDALSLNMNATASTANSISANANIESLVFRKGPLINMVPRPIGESMEAIPLERPLTMTMDANYNGNNNSHAGVVLFGFRIPDYDVYDLRIRTDANFNTESKIATINQFRLWSGAFGLNLESFGFLDTTPGSDVPFRNSDLRLALTFTKNELRKMYDTWELGGKIQLNGRMRGDLKRGKVTGTIDIDDLDVRNESKKLRLLVEDVNMNFPYEYEFTSSFTGKSKIAADKTDVISNQFFVEKDNFSIKSIKAVHPSRDLQYEYIKDLSASMEFRNNAFTINRFKSTVLNGSIYLRDTFFYLADFSLENMEYNVSFDATNIDIGKLDNPNKETRESDLSLTTRLSGKGLNIQENLTIEGYITIYKMGEGFADELMKAISEEEGESKLGPAQGVVDNSMLLDKFIFYIDKGNVYTTIKLKPKMLALVVGIENDEIKYERIPIQEFLSSISGGE
jgi:hypothetical protein